MAGWKWMMFTSALALVVPGGAALAAQQVTLKLQGPKITSTQGALGGIEAVFAYVEQKEKAIDKDGKKARLPVLKIRIEGKLVVTFTGVQTDFEWPLATAQIAEMDKSNPYPEVLLSSFTGGAHCCNVVKVATSSKDGKTWKIVDVGEFDGGPRVAEDADGDGTFEVVQADNRFLYLFSSYAGSFPPFKIWRLEGAETIDVTRDKSFLPVHRKQQKEFTALLRIIGKEREKNGILAGYVANSVLLGQGKRAWKVMLKLYDRKSDWGLEDCVGGYDDKDKCRKMVKHKNFPLALKSFLDREGYRF